MGDRPKRFLIEFSSDEEPLELDEEETAMLYRLADEEGVEPAQFLRSHINMLHILMKAGLLKKENIS